MEITLRNFDERMSPAVAVRVNYLDHKTGELRFLENSARDRNIFPFDEVFYDRID